MSQEQKELVQQIQSVLESHDRVTLVALLADQWSSDIAEVVELVDDEQRSAILDALDTPTAAEVLEKVNAATRERLFELLSDQQIQHIFSELDYDDAADLLAEMPPEVADKVLRNFPPADRFGIQKLLRYSADSAGGIMDPLVISVHKDASIAEAISKIRAAEIDEDFYWVYVVDDNDRLVGDVRLRLLLTRPENARIGDLVDPDTIYVTTEMDQEEVRNIFSKHDLIAVPVVDENHRLVGRITADRVIEVAEEEAAEDVYVMAGTDPDELEKFSALHAARVRLTWLLPCLIGTGITALVLVVFKHSYPAVFVAAAAFAPMIGAMSGNAGLQTSTIVVQGLATGHLAALKFGTVFIREVRIALLVAVCCGLLGGTVCASILHLAGTHNGIDSLRLVLAFGTAMFSAIMVATTLGLLLPFVFRRIHIDPAISSGPLVTTANDSVSVAIYMTLAVTLATMT
jgi:magnesium transporter